MSPDCPAALEPSPCRGIAATETSRVPRRVGLRFGADFLRLTDFFAWTTFFGLGAGFLERFLGAGFFFFAIPRVYHRCGTRTNTVSVGCGPAFEWAVNCRRCHRFRRKRLHVAFGG